MADECEKNGDNASALQPIVKRHNEDMRLIVLYAIRLRQFLCISSCEENINMKEKRHSAFT
jgi:hypothetical protein